MSELFAQAIEEVIESVDEIARLGEYRQVQIDELYEKLAELQRAASNS